MKHTARCLGLALMASACAPAAPPEPGCTTTVSRIVLPDAVREASGVATSLEHPGIHWTHNDAGSMLFALNQDGAVSGRYHVDQTLRDWEDIALSTCPGGGSCLYLADLGDNYEERERFSHTLHILRVPEPNPSTTGAPDTLATDVFPVRLPDGDRDIEALIVARGERIFAVTKGRNHPVTVYRYPGTLRPDTVVLEEVQRLTERARIAPRQVTGGAASPVADVVALRTYGEVRFYAIEADTLAPLEGGTVNLRHLEEAQGEGVSIGLNGQVVLSSEGGPAGGPARMSVLRCEMPGL